MRKTHSPQPFPAIDPLEPRALLAASIAVDGTLEVVGTDGPDVVTIRLGAQPNQLNVQEGNTTLFVFLLDRVKSVSVNLGAGDDTLDVDTAPGLVTGAAGDLSIKVDGGAGNDALQVFGAPAAGGVNEVLAFGPDANSGTLVGSIGAGSAQALGFANMESVADTSTAASLTILGNDASNVIELTAGPLAGGVTPTGTVRVSDVAGATPAPVTPPTPSAPPPPTGPTTPSTPAARSKDEKREAKRIAEEAKKEAKRLAKEAKKEAKRLAKEAKRLAHEKKRAESHARRRKTAVPAAAAATSAAEPLSIARAYLPFHFANKIAVTIDAKGGDDLLDVNVVGSVPAGLQALTLDGGAGADRLARQSPPAGVTVRELNLESTSATSDFALAAERSVLVDPPIPAAPPPTPASAGDEDDGDNDEDKKEEKKDKDEKNHKDDRDDDESDDED